MTVYIGRSLPYRDAMGKRPVTGTFGNSVTAMQNTNSAYTSYYGNHAYRPEVSAKSR